MAVFSVGRQPRGSSAPPSITTRITIEGNSIRDNEGRGILICQSRKGIHRSNSVLRCDGPSILVKNEALGKPAPQLAPVLLVSHAEDITLCDNIIVSFAPNPVPPAMRAYTGSSALV